MVRGQFHWHIKIVFVRSLTASWSIIDLLCISDKETWEYGEALRSMAIEKGFDNISFSRIRDLLDISLPDNLTEIVYVANCTNFRRLLLNQYGKANLDIDEEITRNADTKLTYLGYKRFLESDLQHIFPRGKRRSAHNYKRDCKYLAKQMLLRGYVRIITPRICHLGDFATDLEE